MSGHEVHPPSIPEFFENKCVLVTGATGFIGRLLVEKLLRECPKIKRIYVLLRAKKGKSANDRIKDVIDIPIFEKIRTENSELLNKIVAVPGNTEQIGLGLSEEDREKIINNVTIIFHLAASIRFNDHLKTAVFSNTRSQRECILLARKLKKVDVFVDCSTAYSNCDNINVEEKIYPAKIHYEDLIRIAEECDARTIEILSQKLIYPMPNTYTFTKAIGESAVQDLAKGKVPTVIARPTIVKPTHSDPVKGWVDNINGSSVFHVASGRGIFRVFYGRRECLMDNVFADSVVKALIIASWKKALSCDKEEVTVYNIASDFMIRLDDEVRLGYVYVNKYPPRFYIWPPYTEVAENFLSYFLLAIWKHMLPAIFFDMILRIMKREPRLWKIQRKTFLANTFLFYFMYNTWNFENNNYHKLRNSVLEKDMDSFSITHFGRNGSKKHLYDCMKIFYDGSRVYLTNEPLVPTEAQVKKHLRWRLVDKVLHIIFYGVILYVLFCKFRLISVVGNRMSNYFDKLDSETI